MKQNKKKNRDMEILSKDKKIDVEALKSQLLSRRTIQPRFKLEMTEQQATDILLAAYQAEVEFRRRKFNRDDQTTTHCRQLAQYLTNDDAKFGVMLCGVCGNGKTTMLYAFRSALNWLSERGAFSPDTKGIWILDAKDIIGYAREGKEMQRIRAYDMIAIEDMGKEAVEVREYGNILNPVIDLLEYRYNNQLFTFITTNLTGREIRERYGDRIADRFNEMMNVIIFSDNSYRL